MNVSLWTAEPIFERREGGKINTYEWLDIDNLDNIKLYPLFVKKEIKNSDKTLKHIITNEMLSERRLCF